MASNLDRRSRYSLKMIKSSFVTILKDKPIEEVTVTEICKKADINRGTFYKYFKDVYDLNDKLEDQIISRLIEMIDKNLPGNPEQLIYEFFEFVEQYYMSISLNFTTKQKGKFLNKLQKALFPYIEKFIINGIDGKTEEEKIELGLYLIGGIVTSCAAWVTQKNRRPAKEVAHQIYKLNSNLFKNAAR